MFEANLTPPLTIVWLQQPIVWANLRSLALRVVTGSGHSSTLLLLETRRRWLP